MLRLYVICVALAICACSDGEAHKLAKVRDQVCACKTSKCADDALAQVPKGKIQSTPRARRLAREMLDCLAAVHEKDRPTQDPDAEAAPDDAP
ncbi:MAG TPA: hypothetical protein VFS15_23065 [Kofleriaceae bacterium]|nr:hypothetical protein [Kofleriaceae bacterium]